MKIVWDERKRLTNIEKHGLDFAMLYDFDWAEAKVAIAYRSKYGHTRWKATSLLYGQIVSVIFAPLGSEAISAISFRIASDKERREYVWTKKTRH